jgi:hypothetical protein
MIVAIFCFLISFAGFWFSIKLIRWYMKVKRWTKTEAIVVSKKIEKHAKYSSARSPYAVRVNYQYTFNQQIYQNSKVYLVELINGQVNHIESAAKKTLDTIKEKLEVFVNPNNPQQSVVFCKGIALYVFVFVTAIMTFLMGLSNLMSGL